MKARIGGFPSQTLIQGSLLFLEGLLLSLRRYVFDSNDHGKRLRIECKDLNI
jgi:hypothetical protein